jgi:cellobiose phosphorylase
MFCHMAVMFAYALYARGRTHEGFRVLHTIYEQSRDFEHSRIYPGIPEYFNARGRGMYPYLTGSASWYLVTLLTMAFGVRGRLGDLALRPQLVVSQFDERGEASVETVFADRRLRVVYHNPKRHDAGQYQVRGLRLNGTKVPLERKDDAVLIKRKRFTETSADGVSELRVELD